MADKLTLRPSGALESRFSDPSDSAAEEDLNPERKDFFTGVRRGIRKLGSISGAHNRPSNIQTGGDRDREKSSATATPDLTPGSADSSRRKKHAPSSSDLSRAKPLPKTPLS